MTESGELPSGVTIAVTENDTLPEILGRVRVQRGKAVTLSIPEHSPVFLTATEFRTLRDVVETNDVQLSLQTDDPLRQQLASMFNLMEFARPQVTENSSDTDREMESTPAFRGWRGARARHTGQEVPEDDGADPISISRRRRKELYDIPDPRSTETNVGLSEDASIVSLNYLEAAPGASRATVIGRIVGAVLVVALILGLASWYYMPGTSVQARLVQGQVSTELLYSVTRPGSNPPRDAAFSVPASEVSDTVAFDIEVPATGLESTPNETATGVVTIRNASDGEVTLPAGTSLTTVTGLAFVTDTDVTIPAGSPDGSTIGEATANVTASQPGGASNLEIGALSGKVADQPLYFSNREQPTAGGSDIEVAVVSEADITTAEDLVANDLQRAVAEDWTTQLPDGQEILGPSVVPGTPQYSIGQEVGDYAEFVVVTGTVDATGLQYDQASVSAQAMASYETALAAEVPNGYELLTDTVTLGEPELVSQAPNSVEYTMAATATVRAIFTESDQKAVQSDLAGKSEEEALALLANIPAIESFSLERSPGWWPGGLPRATDRITIVLEDTPTADAPDLSTPATPQ